MELLEVLYPNVVGFGYSGDSRERVALVIASSLTHVGLPRLAVLNRPDDPVRNLRRVHQLEAALPYAL